MGRTRVDFEIANNEDVVLAIRKLNRKNICRPKGEGQVDTGATRLVLPIMVLKELGFLVDRTNQRLISRDSDRIFSEFE